ncbi:dihydrolipoamide dehydrogenase [Iodidimonas nitroreducens]|uniref:Dihydrolipoamide dehydrogenase n=1 Tax=Iodidimonas nitroreducens TaxID=1236968 RepID=A0A5A7N4T4_9PROT|nr:FAD-dependent oxidoreductase [Iodidimonas nitroreducens]GAK32468.1 mercuric reductase [alpha proteobacterium Q-1]GER02764.1 dihydrolipoamide dehydrogenase [Iodidimonas nitroreducens]
MSDVITTDLLVIGAGSGGLSVAAGAVQMGARVVLIEKGRMGGDCLNYGCIPSKSLLAAAKAARHLSHPGQMGAQIDGFSVDFKKAHDHVHQVIASIAPHDSVERFEKLGVTVIKGAARFTGPREVMADGKTIRAKRIIIATGSSARVPPIDGLDQIHYYTNETIFDLETRPDHLLIIGAGPIGLEMAQAFRRLGSDVTVLERFKPLPKDDPDLAAVALDQLSAEGIDIRSDIDIKQVRAADGGVEIKAQKDGQDLTIRGSHLLIAAGRAPNVGGLDLAAAGVEHSEKGIPTDARLRTSNKRIFAIGDVRGGLQFTHVAGYEAGIVIRNALFRLPSKADYTAVPWVTYTDPELAQVGLTEAEARERHGDAVQILTADYKDNDRARTEGITAGRVKLMVKDGRPIGASMVGVAAGELIQIWALAISQKLKVSAVAGMIAPYPTLGEINKRVAGAYFTDRLFSDRMKKIVRFIQKLG